MRTPSILFSCLFLSSLVWSFQLGLDSFKALLMSPLQLNKESALEWVDKNMIEDIAAQMIVSEKHKEEGTFQYEDSRLQKAVDELLDMFNSVKTARVVYTSETEGEERIKHYTEMSQEEIPINLADYVDQYVIRINWETEDIRKLLLSTCNEMKINIWEMSKYHKFVDIQLDFKTSLQLLERLFSKNKSIDLQDKYRIKFMISDLAQAVLETYPRILQTEDAKDELSLIIDSKKSKDELLTMMDFKNSQGEVDMNMVDLFFRQYRNLNTIYAWFDILVDTYPDMLELEWIGQTYEGRDIKAIRLSSSIKEPDHSSKTVVITGGLHAREWVSISSTCFVLYKLLQDYEMGKPKALKFLKELDFLFLPVMNPDGYDYTWTTNRLWRKNRQETYNYKCFGIDIDHSFDFQFQKSDDSPCGENYPGESPFECLESDMWNKYLNNNKHKHPIYGYIDLHSYSEEILYPYAYSCTELPRDEENLLELAYGLSKSIRLQSGKNYGVLSACEDRGADLLPGLGAGAALDYMYHNRAYWAFVLKLRDSGSHGFLLPPKYIVPVGKEIYASIKYFASFVLGMKDH